MAKLKCQRRDPTEQWEQLELLFTSPEQRIYEQIRLVVLFGVPPKVREQEIGAAARTLYRRAQRFAHHGMRSLFVTEPASPSRRIPLAIREAVVALKAEHSDLHFCEIGIIYYVRFGRRLNHKAVKHILAETPLPLYGARRYPHLPSIKPASRRIAIIQLHAEGWHPKSIADYLQTTRQIVHASASLNR